VNFLTAFGRYLILVIRSLLKKEEGIMPPPLTVGVILHLLEGVRSFSFKEEA
jgi:hypothetical protein